ncbi:MAG TPA: hypothetical protein VGP07_23715 [Polyangia bacterium]
MSFAQQMGPVSGGSLAAGAVAPILPSNGVQLSDGALLHGGISVEGGYDSNIFYTNDSTRLGSAVLRVTPFVDLTNTARNGEVPSGLFFDLRASLGYREYLSSNSNITRLRAFTPTANVNIEHNSNGTLALGFSDTYVRVQDAPYTETGVNDDIIIRNDNIALAQLRWSPGGGRLQSILRLTNTLDWFDTAALKAGNSMTNEAMVDVSWRWLPKTALYLQVRQGYVVYLNNDDASGLVANGADGKNSSFPLRAVIGIRGLITEKTSISLGLGYQNAFYSSGATTGGFWGSTTAAGELVILPIFATKITFGVHHDFQNSVVGNFFYDDGAYASLAHQTVARLVGQLWAGYDHRRYYGLPGSTDARIDDLIQATASVDFYLKPWAYVGLSYMLAHNSSDYLPNMNLSGTNYTKHQIFARVGFTY